jgi:hemoglobin
LEASRGEDGVMREKQLLIDFLCASAGGPVYYRGRDMTLTHRGMRISESDWGRVPRACRGDFGEVPGA